MKPLLIGCLVIASIVILLVIALGPEPGAIKSWGVCNWGRVIGGSRGKHMATRGALLREEIDSTYKSLIDKKALQMTGVPSDITAVVQKHLPIGLSLEDDRAVLQCAGFAITPSENDRVYAEIDPYGIPFACRSSVTVHLGVGPSEVTTVGADIHAICF